MSNTQKINTAAVSAAIELLIRAASAVTVANEASKAVADQKGGAYSLYVKAGIAAGNAVNFTAASDALFAQIRSTGEVGGKPCGAVKAKGEGATGWNVPLAISSAKSIIGKALANSIPLQEKKKGKNEARSFTAIRKDVFAVNAAEKEKEEAEKVAKMPEGVKKTRSTEGARILAELADIIEKEENDLDLRDLLRRVSDAMRDYGHVAEGDDTVTEQADVADMLEQAGKAPEIAAVPAKARKARNARKAA